MIGRETIWKHILPGMYVKDSKGKTWRVEDAVFGDTHDYLLIDRDGNKLALRGVWLAKPVVVLEPTEEEALATVRDLLGATVEMVVPFPKRPGYCPPLSEDPRRANLTDYQNHLTRYHAIYRKSGPGSKSIKRLIEEHQEEHDKHGEGPTFPQAGDFIPHLHHSKLIR